MSKAMQQKEINDMVAKMMNGLAQSSKPVEEYDTSKLSARQKEIMTTEDKKVVVDAGAGSGKTRVLVERVKYLVTKKEVDPSSIVAITFTNMAADEMKERLVNVPGIGDSFIGTIHSFANRIFASSGSEYAIYTDDKDNEFHKYLIETYCSNLTFQKYLTYKDAKVKVEAGFMSESDLQNLLLPSERFELSEIEKSAKKCSTSKEYPESVETLCIKYNVVTFDQLLKKATEYFESIGASIEYLLVDEFQDIGRLEYDFIKKLNAEYNFYVGDDWQSIYGFKGGNVNIFMSLMKDKKWKQYYLEDNYRNAPEILELGKQIIDQVSKKVDKKVVSKSKAKGIVVVDSKANLHRHLEKIKASGNFQEWFILTRSNKEIMRISSILENMGIPYSTFKKSDMSLAEMRMEMQFDTVKLLTVHTSKGLESKRVILTGNFPIKTPSYMKNEDERKVMYVGITRAEEELIVLN